MFSLQRFVLFPHWAVPRRAAAPLPAGAERWIRPVKGGVVEAFFLPGLGAAPSSPGPAVMYFHGNGERIDDWVDPMSAYVLGGVSVLLVEYRGYSRSAGSPSREAVLDDARWFREVLTRDPRVDATHLILHGRSLGGGVACALAADKAPAALVLQSTFTSVGAVARRFGVPSFLVRDDFDNLTVLRSLDIPVFVLHGTRDRVIPFSQGEALASAARRGKLLAVDADHNDCPPDWHAYMKKEVLAHLGAAGVLRLER